MLIFATVFFALMTVKYFIKGPAFFDTAKELCQLYKDKEDGKRIDTTDLYSKFLILAVYLLIVYIVKITYLFYAYDIDTYKWPTLAMFALMFLPLLATSTKEIHKWTPKGIITSLLWLAYLCYIGARLLGWL